MPRRSPPRAPAELDAAGKALYRTLKAAMRDRQGPTAWQDADHEVLAQACRYHQRARRARGAFEDAAESMITTGDRKQLIVHPFVKIAEQSERSYLDCLDRLGFSPRARAQMSIETPRPGGGKFGLAG